MAEHSAKGKIARPVKNNIFAKTRNKPLERWIRGLLVFKTLIPPSKGTIINNVKQKPIKDRNKIISWRGYLSLRYFIDKSLTEKQVAAKTAQIILNFAVL